MREGVKKGEVREASRRISLRIGRARLLPLPRVRVRPNLIFSRRLSGSFALPRLALPNHCGIQVESFGCAFEIPWRNIGWN